jgi:hypothetical protein
MTVPTFRKLLARRPFQAFRFVMSSGQTYEVRHPEMALLTRSDLLIGVDEVEGNPLSFAFVHYSMSRRSNLSSPRKRV